MIAGKDPRLLVRSEDPFNAEPPGELLADAFVTPVALFFVRNHGRVPAVDPASHHLTVGGRVRRAASYRLDDLRKRFREMTVTATLQCAGNRRRELMAVRPIEGEIPWDAQAIGTAEWTGVRLGDVLEDAGIAPDGIHVEFLGLDPIERAGRREGFGGSIPLARALGDDVLIAYGMNGRALLPIHGFPLRTIVPGYIGARSVKWLASITLRPEPSDNYFQQHAYKMFPPDVTADTVDWRAGEMLGEVPINAVILSPADGAHVPAGRVRCRGYAVAGRHRVERVEVSADGGGTWIPATLDDRNAPYAWTLWEAAVALEPGTHELLARGVDSAGRHQPENPASGWNFKGYMNAARHRITVRAG